VRLATHRDFADFVTKNGVHFFPLAGDPKELMAFMVRHPDMITFDPKEIKAKRAQVKLPQRYSLLN
jgi:sterol 3beta-glucosyltransferase